jgi:hypothetical protein
MRPHRYRIIVSGRLSESTREALEDLCLEFDGTNTGLTGELDQAALHGALNRIRVFGLELVAVNRLDGTAGGGVLWLTEVTPVRGDDEKQTANSQRGARDYLPGGGLEQRDF